MQVQKLETLQTELPLEFLNYLHEKINGNGENRGGRPHFLSVLAKEGKDPKEELLNIIEHAWIKNQNLKQIGKDYGTKRQNIYRILRDIENLSPRMKGQISPSTFAPSRVERNSIFQTSTQAIMSRSRTTSRELNVTDSNVTEIRFKSRGELGHSSKVEIQLIGLLMKFAIFSRLFPGDHNQEC